MCVFSRKTPGGLFEYIHKTDLQHADSTLTSVAFKKPLIVQATRGAKRRKNKQRPHISYLDILVASFILC